MAERVRPWPSIAELREVGQPAHIRSRRNAEHWTAHLFTRSVSVYITRVCVWAGLSANTVTVAMILSGWLAAAALLLPTPLAPVLALALALLQMVLDSVDGEVARWNRSTGPRGVFLDRVAHTTTESFIPIALGARLAMATDPVEWRWAALGGLMATLVLVNKSLNESMRLARAESGLAQPDDSPSARAPRSRTIRRLRRAADFFPVHRLYHSVEQTIVIAVLGALGAVAGFAGDAVALVGLAGALPLVIVGHFTRIVSSAALDPARP